MSMKERYLASVLSLGIWAPQSTLPKRKKNIEKQILTPEQIKENLKQSLLRKGLKEYNIRGIIVFAINKKNAERKANNILNNL